MATNFLENADMSGFVTVAASSTSQMLLSILPILAILGGVLLAFAIAAFIIDTLDYNRVMRRARDAREESDRLLSG